MDDYEDLFDDLEFPLGKTILRSSPKPWHDAHPGVDIYCFYGSEVKTATLLTYKPGYFPDYYPDIQYGSGDGTVPLRSLMACERWKKDDSYKFYSQVFTNAEHNNILGDARLIQAIIKVLGLGSRHFF